MGTRERRRRRFLGVIFPSLLLFLFLQRLRSCVRNTKPEGEEYLEFSIVGGSSRARNVHVNHSERPTAARALPLGRFLRWSRQLKLDVERLLSRIL